MQPKGEKLGLALRPEALHLGRGSDGDVALPATVTGVPYMGSILRVQTQVSGVALALDQFNRAEAAPPEVGASITVSCNARDLIVLNA